MTASSQVGDIEFHSRSTAWRYSAPFEVVTAHEPGEVMPALRRIETATANGFYAAGFLAYEAAPDLDPALEVHAPGPLPLLWFGLYRDAPVSVAPEPGSEPELGPWQPMVSEEEYHEAIARIREFIAAGDTYQVNYTFPMRAEVHGDPLSWFHTLVAAQPTEYACYIDTGRFKILSLSPELFFERNGSTLTCRPMKGTRPRGRSSQEDRAFALELTSSEKERAENLMIVDLLRNDMGRISTTGSVEVTELFAAERYDTLWQMTSAIHSETHAATADILAALFPSGSVTGAPKIRTMQLIRALEPFPRGVYCGAVGWFAPGQRACFNVAIRTVLVDAGTLEARYHVGGGITWDSSPEGEYAECLLKARVLTHRRPDFALLESIRFDRGYFLLDRHLARLADSAAYFGIPVRIEEIRASLLEKAVQWGDELLKVRLLVDRVGTHRIEAEPLPSSVPLRIGFAREPVDDRDVFLFHKTTHRRVYETAKASRPECGDVILWNSRGEVTETTIANIVIEKNGRLLTPPVSSGLLPGVMRAQLLEDGAIEEAVLHKHDVETADAIRLINSVRKWIDATLLP